MPRYALPYVPEFAAILHAAELFDGFALMPVEVSSREVVVALADWLERRGRTALVVAPWEGQWSVLAATLLDLHTTPRSVVMLLGSDDDTADLRTGMRLLNQKRDSLAKHLGCPLLWCGSPAFLGWTSEQAPDFWSIREVPRRIEVVPDLSRVTVRFHPLLEPAGKEEELRPLHEAAKAGGDQASTARMALRLAQARIAKGQDEEAGRLAEEARALFASLLGERGAREIAECEVALGDAARQGGKPGEARDHYQRSLALAAQAGEEPLVALVYRRLGMVAHQAGDLGGAERWYGKAVGVFERLGDGLGEGRGHDDLAALAWSRGDLRGAESEARQALALFEKLGDDEGAAAAYTKLAEVARARGEATAAQRSYGEAQRREAAVAPAGSELRVLFAREGEGLTCRVVPSWGDDGGEALPFVPCSSDEDHEALRWYLEDYLDLPLGGAEVRARRVEQALAEWGRELFAAVFDHPGRRGLHAALLHEPPPRRLTIATKDLELLRLPWELMADHDGPLALHGVSVRRQLEAPRKTEPRAAGRLPLRVLILVSRPDDAGFLDPRHTTRAVLDALEPLGLGVKVDFCRPATLARLERMLASAASAGQPYDVVHLDAHGVFLPNSQITALCFEKEEDQAGAMNSDMVRAERAGEMLAAYGVSLVVLESAPGAAPALIEAGVGSVVSQSHAAQAEATRILLARFHEALSAGASVGAALDAGRGALSASRRRGPAGGPEAPTVALQDWFVPNLYQRGEDPVLVPRGAQQPPTSQGDVRREPEHFPSAPRYGFIGRARELHRVERRLLRHRAVLLHGMGGMGKTALAREAALWGTRTGSFPDGACFVRFEEAGGAQRAVEALGQHFEGAAFEQRSAEEQRRRARELFQEKQALVVWDGVESALPQFQGGEHGSEHGAAAWAEVRELFEEWTADENGKGRLLVTCRPGETGLEGVAKLELSGLATADALGLLVEVMQKVGASNDDRDALVELVEALGRHPLSIELVGAHLGKMGPAEIVRDFRELLDGFREDKAEEERNRSLRASVELSLGRLSEEAREAVRWLGLFRGGVFEDNLLDVSQIEAATWEKIRGELEATALVRVEREVMLGDKPYLRFHPTLAYAVGDGEAGAEVREGFVDVYWAVMGAVDEALHGTNPRWGMDVMVREEANFRTAVGWALALEAYGDASGMGDTLGRYLQRAGRLRERDRWAAWLADEVRKGGFSEAVADRETDEALALLSQGKAEEAIEKLEGLVQLLKETTAFDAGFVLASALRKLGHVYHAVGWSQKAIPVVLDAVSRWEALVDKARAAGESAETERGNLSATLGNLANALMGVGKLDEAMAAAERSAEIDRELGHHQSIVAALVQVAQILMMQGRHAEADARYDEALEAARQTGNKDQEGTVLQQQGVLAVEMGHLERAARLYQRALHLFQEMHDDGAVMQTCNLLGVVEQNAGRLVEARAWHGRSREIAAARKDHKALGVAAQNLGVVCQLEGEAARKQGDEPRARERLSEAARFVGESLAVWRETQNEPHQAASCGQLGRIHFLLGDLDQAEAHAHRAREIHECLGLKDTWKDYDTLADIARARGPAHEPDAATWEQKRDTLRAELRRRAGTPALPIQAFAQLALACAQAGLEGRPIEPQIDEAITTIANAPAPLAALAPFLRALASAETPPIPQGLPADLTPVLQQALDALHAARRGA